MRPAGPAARSFRGRHHRALDDGGRVGVPAGFRRELERRGGGRQPVLICREDHLVLYPAETWDRLKSSLSFESSVLPKPEGERRSLIAQGGMECRIDARGRITIPRDFRDFAGLGGVVAFVGLMDEIEIWNRDLLEATQALTLRKLQELGKGG